jgi:hypothetical protein
MESLLKGASIINSLGRVNLLGKRIFTEVKNTHNYLKVSLAHLQKIGLNRSLARDEPVTPGVACLTAWTLTKKVPRFVKPDFRLCIPRF